MEPVSLPAGLRDVLARELGPGSRPVSLVGRFLASGSYSRPFALDLLDAAAGREGDPWEVRRVAALLLQGQVLRVPAGNLAEHELLLRRLGLLAAGSDRVRKDVLAEGYSTTEVRGFARELRRRMSRARRVLGGAQGRETEAGALRDLLAYARKECRLVLARYLFRPEEVAERILSQVETSRGMPRPFPEEPLHLRDEAQRALSTLPEYEARILDRLAQGCHILWVSDRTSSEINSLLEYPLGTVVLVVKPPGSDREIEIKRAGCRGDRRLGIVYSRGGKPLPPSHRLQGGSMGGSLDYEARSSSLLARLYRAVHGVEAPISRPLAARSIYEVPIDGRGEHICDYFTYGRAFGPGFRRARGAMREAVAAFRKEEHHDPIDLPGELGLTLQFLQCVSPSQSILARTSAFRLDRVALYLSDAGPESYFREGLGREPEPGEPRRLADEVLEEALGVYTAPEARYRRHGRYVAAALALPANRARADRVYLDLMRQIGTFWGTLYAAGGCSSGESFVARNVGLRSCWEEGRWRVRVLFMDHDCLRIGRDDSFPHQDLLRGMWEDHWHILGGILGEKGEAGFLEEIYRIRSAMAEAGRAALLAAARRSYRRTRTGMTRHPEVRPLFRRSFLRETGDWDAAMKRLAAAYGGWREDLRRLLARRGYEPSRIETYLQTVDRHSHFLSRQLFFHHDG